MNGLGIDRSERIFQDLTGLDELNDLAEAAIWLTTSDILKVQIILKNSCKCGKRGQKLDSLMKSSRLTINKKQLGRRLLNLLNNMVKVIEKVANNSTSEITEGPLAVLGMA